MKRLLFVDDEPRMLAGMKRMLHPLRHEWNMEFVGSSAEALERLGLADFDVLITDLMMPGLSGVDLLKTVLDRYPSVTRVILSGAADQSFTLSAVGLAHHYLVKPCDADTLRQTLERAMVLRFLPEGTGLQKFIKSVQSLPVLPAAYTQLLEALDSEDVSIQRIGEAITRDVALTAKVLQLVNSAYFGLYRQIRNPNEAVAYLGTEVVRAIVLSVGVFSQFEKRNVGCLNIAELRDHSLAVASLARKIAKDMKLPAQQIEAVFTGAILHDLGALILACHDPEKYREVVAAGDECDAAASEAETNLFGATHAQVAAYMLWFWGLPDLITQIVAQHHGPLPPRTDPLFGPLIAVRAADQLCRQHTDDQMAWLQDCGFGESMLEWRDLSAEVDAERRIA